MKDLFEHVDKQEEGYYCLKQEFRHDMKEFYKDTYYQQELAFYQKEYSKQELLYGEYMNEEINYTFNILRGGEERVTLLDIGCGEGYLLSHFLGKGYDVCGIDYSIFAVEHHNPKVKSYVIQGDLYEKILDLSTKGRTFDYITANNVLEHVADEKEFWKKIKLICHRDSLISIRVPNDFSIIQLKLFEEKKIDKDFWCTLETGEHNYYFTVESLKKLGISMGFKPIEWYSGYPIDTFLMVDDTNYVMKNGEEGHKCHIARLIIENMLYGQSMEKAHSLHKAYADAGIGREITVVFKLIE